MLLASRVLFSNVTVEYKNGWIWWVCGGCFQYKGRTCSDKNNAGPCSPFPWGNIVMWCGITARHFDESMAGVTLQHYSWMTVRTLIDASVNAMQQTLKQRQHRPWLAVFDLGSHATLLAVRELRFLRLPWLLLWKKQVQCCVILRALIKERAMQYPTWLFTYVLFTVIFWQGNGSAV